MENTLILLLLVPLILLTALQITKRRRKSLPPGPPGLPIIGNFHQLDGTPLHEYFSKLSKTYGPLFYLKLGSRPILVANSSRMAAEILKIQDANFCSRPNLLAFKILSYDYLDIALSPYSEYWREMRKICVLHLLSAKRVQSFAPIREDEVSRSIEKISAHAEKGSIVDVTEIIVSLTSMSICRMAFGKRYEPGSGESKHFHDIILEFQTLLSGFYVTDYFPWLGWVDRISGKLGRLERIFRVWDKFYQQLIDEHLSPDWKRSNDGDVIDIMLQFREKNPGSFDLHHIKAVLVNVYFASTDTISTTTIWIMTALMKNPSAMRKAQDELRSQLSLKDKQLVKNEDLVSTKLPYFNAVIKEAMRIYTTIPLLLPRETIKTCTIDGFEIPEKTLVYVNTWAISKDPELWENPNEFFPERFLLDEKKSSMDLKGQDFELMPFGVGRRGCPGITMAMATVEIIVANLLYNFDWELPGGMKEKDVDVEFSAGMTMHKKNPLCLVAKKFV